VLGLIVLAGCLAVAIVGAAAIALPIRRPDLYRSSPANVKFLGIPKWIRARQGINVGFVYKELPPE
jgi:hypothetical protein